CSRFERKTQHPKNFVMRDPKRLADLFQILLHSALINTLGTPEKGSVHVVLLRQVDEGAKILWQTVTSESQTCVKELISDAGIQSDPMCHFCYVGSHGFAEIRNHVDERDFSC